MRADELSTVVASAPHSSPPPSLITPHSSLLTSTLTHHSTSTLTHHSLPPPSLVTPHHPPTPSITAPSLTIN